MARTLITFGAGPGIGNHTSAEFASKGFDHIILLSRNNERLQSEDAPFIKQSSPDVRVDTLRLDLSDLDSIPSVLQQIDDLTQNENVEVIFFNAARISPNGPQSVTVAEIDEDFKVRIYIPFLDCSD